MSILATQTVNGYGVSRPTDAERARARARAAPPNSRDASPARRNADLPRSASYTFIENAKNRVYSNPSLVKDSFSEADLVASGYDTADLTTPDSSGLNTPDERLPEIGQHAVQTPDLIAGLQKSAGITVQPLPVATEGSRSSVASSMRYQRSSLGSSETISTAPTTPKARNSVASNFSRKLNRRSWAVSTPSSRSRSPSPHKKEGATTTRDASPTATPTTPQPGSAPRRKSLIKRDSFKPKKEKNVTKENASPANEQPEEPESRRSSLLRKKTARPLSGVFKSSSNDVQELPATYQHTRADLPPLETALSTSSPIVENEAPATYKPKRQSTPSLPKSFSTDKLPIHRPDQPSPNRAAPVPRLLSSERMARSGPAIPKKKDELWGVFRSLDGDFSKFASKTVAFKANVVRSNLLPFLWTYATHSSNKTLRPEDLDRRTNILNKWWTGLIEMLHGQNNQSISGTDRPAILDGIGGIMERPEWRLPPSPFCPLNQRMKGTSTPLNRSTSSLTSNTSDFLAESVHHNVRNIFVQNLSAQMAFVVDKMSLRNASASLVSFCGKACAYAFMFVPGMADVLVRLWDLQIDHVRRVLEGNGVHKFDNLTDVAGGVVPGFPPALHQLGFSSLTKYMRRLRISPPLPLGTANIEWYGHWLDRWAGRESDLFYVFVKYFHILAADFLPSDPSMKEQMCAPGFLPVHAQVLTNLDATIHREATQGQQDSTANGPSPTFDDVLADPDAVATALPLPPANASRLMAENRLIMLIRDFLSERATEYPVARQLFARSVNNLLQTAACGTSMFDHAACYTLLDFLEEALALLVRFEHLVESERSLIDIDFWMVVWKKMIQSQNTMTEIRLYAFLYTVWNTVIGDLGWKADVCDGLVLDPTIFESRFNHWCPMVRAYFMRLLCWRVGRYDGEASEENVATLQTLLERLQSTWSHYVFLREQSQALDTLAPPTNPCYPAPSRRLLIIRTDQILSSPGTFLSFDGIVSPKTPTNPTPLAWKRSSTISQISHILEIDTRPSSALSLTSEVGEEPRGRGIGGFFRNLIGSKSRSKSRGSTQPRVEKIAPPLPASNGLTRSATDGLQAKAQSSPPIEKPAQPFQHQNFSFKFSLEYQSNTRPLPPMRLFPPRLPMPAQQLLQSTMETGKAPNSIRPKAPTGESVAHARYCGRALAEWAVVLGECQSFFDRRKNEGVPSNKLVETPTLGVEVFRRPG